MFSSLRTNLLPHSGSPQITQLNPLVKELGPSICDMPVCKSITLNYIWTQIHNTCTNKSISFFKA